MSDDAAKVPTGMRAHAYAGVELMLDMVYAARQRAPIDLESLLIYLTVSEATMRPLLLDGSTPADVLELAEPPEQYRGSITRVLVADRLALPRETVRRKVQKLLKLGLVQEDEDGRVRTTRNFADPRIQSWIRDSFIAVQRYDARLKQFGRAGVSGPKPTDDTPFP